MVSTRNGLKDLTSPDTSLPAQCAGGHGRRARKLWEATGDALVFEHSGEWYYEMKIMARRDVNGDGIKEPVRPSALEPARLFAGKLARF